MFVPHQRQTTIDHKALSSDEGGIRTKQKRYRSSYLRGPADPPKRYHSGVQGVGIGILKNGLRVLLVNRTGKNAINPHTPWPKQHCIVSRHLFKRGLADMVSKRLLLSDKAAGD
jgi:hypothetical protein